MDLSSIFSSLLSNSNVAGLLEEEAVKHGVSPAIVSEFAQGAQQILADGKVSKEEVVQQLLAHAEAKGVPTSVVHKVLGTL